MTSCQSSLMKDKHQSHGLGVGGKEEERKESVKCITPYGWKSRRHARKTNKQITHPIFGLPETDKDNARRLCNDVPAVFYTFPDNVFGILVHRSVPIPKRDATFTGRCK